MDWDLAGTHLAFQSVHAPANSRNLDACLRVVLCAENRDEPLKLSKLTALLPHEERADVDVDVRQLSLCPTAAVSLAKTLQTRCWLLDAP